MNLSGGAEKPDAVSRSPAPAGRGQRHGARSGISVIGGRQGVEHVALQSLEVVDVHARHATGGQNQTVGLTNDELIRRYQAGERLDELAAAAEMTRSGLYDRLRRIGVNPRTASSASVDDEAIRNALDEHGSVNAAAKALGIPRARLGADAVRLGLRARPPSIPADLEEVYRTEGSVERVAAHYDTTDRTVSRWLRGVGVTLRPGRKPRDG